MKLKLIVMAAVLALGALVAVGAGAFDREPVAPELTPAESGVKPGVEPGKSGGVVTPDGKVLGGVSPCIASDPAGYSDAELSDPEWCYHAPGKGAGVSNRTDDLRDPNAKPEAVIHYPDGSVKRIPPGD